ncbi:hypothetical protein [Candidatus Dactylopiibacterium carminicum]|uniref:hypothetical protein n=1 Tax=Candidatus Dactylopiibacterium carminicum TaxID=857335 RepID=UPI001CC31298|nr:hypothetical protein [Candidatus Dactylopiibacterium carminicum]
MITKPMAVSFRTSAARGVRVVFERVYRTGNGRVLHVQYADRIDQQGFGTLR